MSDLALLALFGVFSVVAMFLGEMEKRTERARDTERERRRDGETVVDVVFDAIERKRGGK